ncbi:hypothetical protein LOCC1_G001949 [Lachnellula occidentalis]|uniref:Pathway-specific nitrogen regulator n=1 Tax=Lachnellula occidentalis TaxID=215460 RepID=A0A8H8S7K4_9HELO|nr:hypothetical protein LOCC1_G001949 [Lachnellula occidentalis]
MGKTTSDQDFKIHVDPSCLTDSTDLQMPAERVTSNETVVHHDSWSAESPEEDVDIAGEAIQDKEQEDRDSHHLDGLEEKIQAAARAVVASMENDEYSGNQDSELSIQTDENDEGEGTEFTYDGTETSAVDGTEVSYESGTGDHSELHSGTEALYDSENEHLSENGDAEAEQQAHYESENEESSELHNATEGTEVTYDSETEHYSEQGEVQDATSNYGSENEHHSEQGDVQDATSNYGSENEHHSDNEHGDSSSHHDGDIEDDVFSQNSGHSPRSSLNSSDGLHSSDDISQQKELTSPAVGEEASSSQEDDVVSQMPSTMSFMHPIPDADPTPSRVLSRPPFRTPSSIRAMQMSSPTTSTFSSPQSTKRRLPTVSRIGTPTSHASKHRTPSRFKIKREYPLILLHVTILPLQWPYSHLMSSPDLPESLQKVKESWRLLQQKLGDAVLERGVLLPHPQDSYEVLEERLLETLELPVRPRALILKCGHYMGPEDIETPSSDEEGGDYLSRDPETRRKWCDICAREVRLEDRGDVQGKRYTIKTYASNGLMRAGAWAAVWREMERVDIEIEPYIELQQHSDLEKMATMSKATPVDEEKHWDGFVDEEVTNETEQHVIPEDIEEPAPEVAVEESEEIMEAPAPEVISGDIEEPALELAVEEPKEIIEAIPAADVILEDIEEPSIELKEVASEEALIPEVREAEPEEENPIPETKELEPEEDAIPETTEAAPKDDIAISESKEAVKAEEAPAKAPELEYSVIESPEHNEPELEPEELEPELQPSSEPEAELEFEEPEPEPQPSSEPEAEHETEEPEPGPETELQPEPEPELEPAHEEAAAEEHIDEDEQRRMDEAELNDILEEERRREIYEQSVPIMEEPMEEPMPEPEQERPQPPRRSSSGVSIDEASLPDLLLAAFKVTVRDRRNLVIVILSGLVLLLALRPRDVVYEPQMSRASNVPEIISDGGRQAIEVGQEAAQSVVEMATSVPSKIAEVIREVPVQVTEKAQTVADVVEEMASKATDKVEELKCLMAEETESKSADEVEEVDVPMIEETNSESADEVKVDVAMVEETNSKSADEVEEIRAPILTENIELEASAEAEDENIDAPMMETKGEATIDETTQDTSSDMEDQLPAAVPGAEADGKRFDPCA